MNSITFGIGYILTFLMVFVSSTDYFISSENKVSVSVPFNFSFNLKQVLLMSITLKNVPPSVTTVYLIYTTKQAFYREDHIPPKKIKVDAEIKNGEVKIMFLRSLGKDYNVLIDIQLETNDGICNKLRIAEGRYDHNSHYYKKKGKNVFWHTHWKYNDKFFCIAPNLCEMEVDFYNRCAEPFLCYYNATKYVCTLSNESQKFKHYKLYQTYDDDDVSRAKLPFREDYTYIEAIQACYKIHMTPKNWNDAKQLCIQEEANLFYPENSDEVTAVLAFWKSTSSLNHMYVGISDIVKEGQFRTIDDKPITDVYNEWNYSQPKNYGNEDCVHIDQQGKYNEVPCNSQYSFICKKNLLSPERNIQHNLSSLIGASLNVSAMNTKLIIELESFDNNTSFNVVPLKFFRKYKLWSKKIILTAKDLVKYNTVKTLKYSETTEVPFSCQEYTAPLKHRQTFTALITKENKIKTFNETQKIQRKFKMSDNASVLCCLYYEYKPNNDGKELQITRFVVNKNLLVYQYLNPGENKQQSSLLANSYNYNWIIYVSATLIGVFALILALYFILKQGWFKKSQPNAETVEMDNQIDQNQVLYATLEFVNIANQPHRNQNEESHYADIIGTLHPH